MKNIKKVNLFKWYFIVLLGLGQLILSCEQEDLIISGVDAEKKIKDKDKDKDKLDVCHLDEDTGLWGLKSFSTSSIQRHLEHGDVIIDEDGDGFAVFNECGILNENGIDCDDSDNTINPGVDEICDNGIDDNCDGNVDEGCENIIYIDDVILEDVTYYRIVYDTPTTIIYRNLTTINNNISFHQCENIVNVQFPKLETVDSHVYFHQNIGLVEVDAPNLTSVGSSNPFNSNFFYFYENNDLTSINAPALEDVYGYVFIARNFSLDVSTTICGLKNVYSPYNIYECTEAHIIIHSNANDQNCFDAVIHPCE